MTFIQKIKPTNLWQIIPLQNMRSTGSHWEYGKGCLRPNSHWPPPDSLARNHQIWVSNASYHTTTVHIKLHTNGISISGVLALFHSALDSTLPQVLLYHLWPNKSIQLFTTIPFGTKLCTDHIWQTLTRHLLGQRIALGKHCHADQQQNLIQYHFHPSHCGATCNAQKWTPLV